jgi:hypothetical protein
MVLAIPKMPMCVSSFQAAWNFVKSAGTIARSEASPEE